MLNIELNISETEKEILVKALERYISDLNMEIADTDQMNYREMLKSERISLKKILTQIDILKQTEVS